MAHIFEDNPNAYNFIITNNSNEYFNLSEGSVNIPPGASGDLVQFSVDFCLFKYKYTMFAAVKSWFDSGALSAVPINGGAPVVCPWEPSTGGGSSGVGTDTARVKVSLLDNGADYLDNKLVVDSATLQKDILSIGGDLQLKLTGLIQKVTDLTDVPASYSGHTGKVLTVNSSETGMVFSKWKDSLSFGPLLTWPVDHNFGYEPVFAISDINNAPRLFVDFRHINNNRLEIYWGEPTAGTIRLR